MLQSTLTGTKIEQPIYQSEGGKSITSLSKVYERATIVYLDTNIGHLQTQEIASIDDYYDVQYEFFNQSDEDDVLYKVIDGKKIFRQQHQVETLLSKVNFSSGMQILDYGCAKGTVMKRLAAQRPDITTYLFDVSKMYVGLWEKFLDPEQYASYQPKTEWANKFDVVTSFFAFEHTPNPLKELATIKNLLNDNGLVYLIVPNVFENIGDFIVADHVHHYSETSLRYMMAKAGFETIEVDAKSHFAAFIVVAKKTAQESISFVPDTAELERTNTQCRQMAIFWNNLQMKIRNFENSVSNKKAAIYGAGVYGNFIATCLQSLDSISCFIDQNPLLKDTKVFQKPVFKPSEIPSDIEVIYVGLNPVIAKQVIEGIEEWQDKSLEILFL
jgi:2-polyprenyl-3-methyl-5-hydroxy-6-metoxy-1,4-benzoquinol methylase